MSFLSLPIEVEARGQQVGVHAAECRLATRHRMNPIEHHPHAIRPIPIAADRQIVVLAVAAAAEVQVGPASLSLQCAEAMSTRGRKHVRVRHVPSELSTMLTEPLEQAVLSGEEVADMRIRTADLFRVTRQNVDVREISF